MTLAPIAVCCPYCQGTGKICSLPCPHCAGKGTCTRTQSVQAIKFLLHADAHCGHAHSVAMAAGVFPC